MASISKYICVLLVTIILPLILCHSQATAADPGQPECKGEACGRPEVAQQHEPHSGHCACQHPIHYPWPWTRPPCGVHGQYPAGSCGGKPGVGHEGGQCHAWGYPWWTVQPPHMHYPPVRQCYNYITGRVEPCPSHDGPHHTGGHAYWSKLSINRYRVLQRIKNTLFSLLCTF